MSHYTVGDIAKAEGLLVVGSLAPNDPRLQDFLELGLMRAYFDFPSLVRTLALCDAGRKTLSGLLYAESSDDVLRRGPGKCEPLGAVDFNFETGDITTHVLQDEPVLKALIDGKRRAWREKHPR